MILVLFFILLFVTIIFHPPDDQSQTKERYQLDYNKPKNI